MFRLKNARRHGHIHIDELLDRASLFENDRILIMHLSARHRIEEAQEIAAQKARPPIIKDINITQHKPI